MPVWDLYLLVVTLMLLAAAFGGWIAGRTQRHPTDQHPVAAEVDRSEYITTIVGATLGLFAFMLAFTFEQAANRFESRRLLVIKDANAIGTTFLRAEMLPPAEAEKAMQLLRDYIELRVGLPGDRESMRGRLKRSDDLQDKLWEQAKAAAAKSPTPITAQAFADQFKKEVEMNTRLVKAVGLQPN